MAAIIKREISAYFLSAIGYIVLAAFYIFGGFYFYMSELMAKTNSPCGFDNVCDNDICNSDFNYEAV